jgi:hypothetical protein
MFPPSFFCEAREWVRARRLLILGEIRKQRSFSAAPEGERRNDRHVWLLTLRETPARFISDSVFCFANAKPVNSGRFLKENAPRPVMTRGKKHQYEAVDLHVVYIVRRPVRQLAREQIERWTIHMIERLGEGNISRRSRRKACSIRLTQNIDRSRAESPSNLVAFLNGNRMDSAETWRTCDVMMSLHLTSSRIFLTRRTMCATRNTLLVPLTRRH